MPDVRGHRFHEAFARIHREREEPFLFDPPVAIEALLQLRRVLPVRPGGVALAEHPRHHRHQTLGGKPVALQLACRDGRGHRTPIVVDDGVAAVLPALVLGAHLRARLVFEISVAIAIAVLARPVENAACGVPVTANHLRVADPRIQIRERDDVHQRTGKVRVVRVVRILVEDGERPGTHLIRNASGFLVVPGVEPVALHPPQPQKRRGQRAASIDHRRLPAGGHGVAAEERWIERHASLKREPFVAVAVEQRKGGDVTDVAGDDLLGERVARNLDAREARAPLLDRCAARLDVLGSQVVDGTGRPDTKRQLPDLLRRQVDFLRQRIFRFDAGLEAEMMVLRT